MTEINGQVDVFDLMERLGVRNAHAASGGSEVNFSCPLSGHAHGDERPSAYMNATTTSWMCQGCKERGRSAVSFVAKVQNVTYAVARTFINTHYGIDFREPVGGSMAAETEARFRPLAEVPQPRRPAPSWQTTFVSDLFSDVGARAFDYARGRGFEADTLHDWGFGYDALSDRLTIPVHDVDGELVGFKARALDDERLNKYLVLGDRDPTRSRYGFDPYEASAVVFGLHRAREHREVVICEGEFNDAALEQMGVPRPVGLGMSHLSDRQLELIVREAESAVAFFDTDEGGASGLWGHSGSGGLVERLERHMPLRIVPPHAGDPASMQADGRTDDALQLIEDAVPAVRLITSV